MYLLLYAYRAITPLSKTNATTIKPQYFIGKYFAGIQRRFPVADILANDVEYDEEFLRIDLALFGGFALLTAP